MRWHVEPDQPAPALPTVCMAIELPAAATLGSNVCPTLLCALSSHHQASIEAWHRRAWRRRAGDPHHVHPIMCPARTSAVTTEAAEEEPSVGSVGANNAATRNRRAWHIVMI